ncbi:MAG: 16S rRNA (uracil(1498)-N(3))-methyltransferase [Candidatus Vogelbacteria bacterium]|nr:16S rRNA (uracil(1498)-N(3))-methyltransferase [Candidatus Vogelbacteria bacterium]
MSYFLSDKPLKVGEISNIEGEEAKHILLSRRMRSAMPDGRQGEKLKIQDINGKRFLCEFITASRESLDILALEEITSQKEPALKIYIFQSLIKEQPLDNILQKATELGATGIFIFSPERSLERFKEMDKKLDRWNKISLEAAKQSDRISPLKISYLTHQEDVIKRMGELDQVFLLEPTSKETFATWELSSQVNSIGILVGPEGGFSTKEIETFSGLKKVIKISMGPRILRADTASIVAVAIIQSLWGDMK